MMLTTLLQSTSLFLSIFIGLQAVDTPAKSSLTISGDIKTYDSKPASGYTVDIIGTSHSSLPRLRVSTDDKGHFEAAGLKMGEYVLAPYLEDQMSRYPAGTSSFYTPHPFRLTLTPSSPSRLISIQLGPPNLILSGLIKEQVSNSPVLAVIQIEYPDDPYRFIRFSSARDGSYKIRIPEKTLLKVTISAPGYQTLTTKLEPFGGHTDPQMNYNLTALH